jgi:hypothetical protein
MRADRPGMDEALRLVDRRTDCQPCIRQHNVCLTQSRKSLVFSLNLASKVAYLNVPNGPVMGLRTLEKAY